MNAKTKPMPPLLRESDVTLHWLRTNIPGMFAPTDEQIAIARYVLAKGWSQRAAERDDPQAAVLTGACKFASLFVKIAFGGTVEGAEVHQYNILAGHKLDLSLQDQFADVDHDDEFFGNPEHLESLRSCMPRVLQWIDAFDDLLGQRKFVPIDIANGPAFPGRDRDAEYTWAAEVQSQYDARHRAVHSGLINLGFAYDAQYSKYSRGDIRVWHTSGHPHTQRTLDMLFPFAQWTVKTIRTVHDTVRDRLHLTTDEILADILQHVHQHETEYLEIA